MRILIGSPRGVFIIDDALGNHTVKHILQGSVYGVSFNEDKIFVARRKHNIVFLDKNLKRSGTAPKLQIASVHQIHYDVQDKLLYITDTVHDRIVAYDPVKNKIQKQIKLKGATNKEMHFNSVWRNPEDKKIYGYIHCFEGISNPPEQQRPYAIRLDDNLKIEHKWRMGKKGHNVYVENGYIYVLDTFGEDCNTKKNHIVSRMIRKPIDSPPESQPSEILFDVSEYVNYCVRGLCVSDDHVVVGLSTLGNRGNRMKKCNHGYVVIYDRNYKKIKDIHIKNCGQVYETRLLDVKDYAHNGIIFQ
jgi:hypothetical protein